VASLNTPDPDVIHKTDAELDVVPFTEYVTSVLHIVASEPALTIGAVVMVKSIVLVAGMHEPPPVAVKVRVAFPLEISCVPGV